MTILVTGATGFLGRHVMARLGDYYNGRQVVGLSSNDFDLMRHEGWDALFKKHEVDTLIHLAAYSGGIGANKAFPADFYFRNTMLTALAFEYAARFGVNRLIYTMGGCSYPGNAISPITEDQLWKGYPQEESAGYSCAKMMGTVASASYKSQKGLSSTVLIPGNMYGEYDNFKVSESHVIPAMIRRYYEAKTRQDSYVEMWGTGAAQRDFVYAGDVADMLISFIDDLQDPGPINLSSGTSTTIRQLAEIVAAKAKYQGTIEWDSDKPEGQMVKLFSTEKMTSLGLSASTPLEAGLDRTIEWFSTNYGTNADGIRL